MKIIVTGSRGFVGSSLVKYLRYNGVDVLGLGRRGIVAQERDVPGINDLGEADWDKILNFNPDAIVHSAGPSSVVQSFVSMSLEVRDSVLLTTRILEKIRNKPNIKFVYISSAAVYGDQCITEYSEDMYCNPSSPYGICKLACEQLIRSASLKWGLKYIILRPFSIYGPGLRKQVVHDIVKRMLCGENPLYIQSTGNEVRDFVYVSDLCNIILKIIKNNSIENITLNIGTGTGTTIKQLAATIISEFDKNTEIIFAKSDKIGNPVNLVADVNLMARYSLLCETGLGDGIRIVVDGLKQIYK